MNGFPAAGVPASDGVFYYNRQPMKENIELFRVPLLDNFFKKSTGADGVKKKISVEGKTTTKVLTPLTSGKKIVYDDLFTLAKLPNGIEREHQKLIESGFALLHQKGQKRQAKQFTFVELARFINRDKSVGSTQYIETAQKFIDLTKLSFHNGESMYRLFVAVGVRTKKKFLAFDFSDPLIAEKLLENTIFQMPEATYIKFKNSIGFCAL